MATGSKEWLHEWHDSFPELTGRQSQIITGSLLGDAWLTRAAAQSNSILKHLQCPELYGYVKWFFGEMQPYSKAIRDVYREKKPVCIEGIVKNISVPEYLAGHELTTHTHPTFTVLRKKWYPNDVKTVPADITLTPLSVATWYWDDGSDNLKTRTATISTECFSVAEVELLVDKLKVFNLFPSVYLKQSNKGKQPILKFRRNSYDGLIELVKPFLPCDCLAYKTDWRPAAHRWITKEEAKQIVEMRKTTRVPQIAEVLGVSQGTVYNALKGATKGANILSK